MKIDTKTILAVLGVVMALMIVMVLVQDGSRMTENRYAEEDLKEFASCIADSGARLFGAFWCSHCQEQKEEFGDAQELLPYIECATPDGRGQTSICQENNIAAYPTWIFSDSSRETGKLPFALLSERTGCAFPLNATEQR